MKAGSLILVHLIEDLPEGYTFRRKRLGWPLHITLVPWFSAINPEKFMKDLHSLLVQEQGFKAIVGGDASFGNEHEIPVSLMTNTRELGILHNFLLTVLGAHRAKLLSNTQWIRENYNPHITHHGDARLHPGQSVVVDMVSVVQVLDDDICEIIMNIPLGDPQ